MSYEATENPEGSSIPLPRSNKQNLATEAQASYHRQSNRPRRGTGFDLAEEAENEASFIHHEQSSQPCEELKIVHFIHHKHTTQPRDGE